MTAPPFSPHALGSTLKARRLASGLSIRQLARQAGIDPGTLWRAERGYSGLYVHTLWLLAGALGCRVGELLENTSPMCRK